MKSIVHLRRSISIRMTTPWAILAGACVIGASIVIARLIAPYQLAAGAVSAWRVNIVTGSVTPCIVIHNQGLQAKCF